MGSADEESWIRLSADAQYGEIYIGAESLEVATPGMKALLIFTLIFVSLGLGTLFFYICYTVDCFKARRRQSKTE